MQHTDDQLNELLTLFKENANAQKASEMKAYMKNKFDFLGIQKPLRESLSKPFIQQWASQEADYQATARWLWGQPYRELHYVAIEFLKKTHKQWDGSTPDFWEFLLVNHTWWDSVDLIASHLVGDYILKFPESYGVFHPWIKSENMWLNRTMILHQLRYKSATNTQHLTECIKPHLASKEFFLQKAIGWALRQFSRYNVDWVKGFVERNELMPLSEREALKWILKNG